jgi:hypothetical protein
MDPSTAMMQGMMRMVEMVIQGSSQQQHMGNEPFINIIRQQPQRCPSMPLLDVSPPSLGRPALTAISDDTQPMTDFDSQVSIRSGSGAQSSALVPVSGGVPAAVSHSGSLLDILDAMADRTKDKSSAKAKMPVIKAAAESLEVPPAKPPAKAKAAKPVIVKAPAKPPVKAVTEKAIVAKAAAKPPAKAVAAKANIEPPAKAVTVKANIEKSAAKPSGKAVAVNAKIEKAAAKPPAKAVTAKANIEKAAAKPPARPSAEAAAPEPPRVLLGCSKCRGSHGGCAQCRNPAFSGKRYQRA